MEPLTPKEYLIPVGNECLIPSHAEAVKTFASQKLFGHITFGIARTSMGDCPCWLLLAPDRKFYAIKAFATNFNAPVEHFTEVTTDSMFNWQGKYFYFVRDDELSLLIKEMSCFPTEAEVLGYACIQDYDNVVIHAVKVYRMGKKQTFLFPSWYIEAQTDSQQPDVILPMFMEDRIILKNTPFDELNWSFMDPQDVFLHDDKLWRLFHNEEDGLYINKLSDFKLIAQKEEG